MATSRVGFYKFIMKLDAYINLGTVQLSEYNGMYATRIIAISSAPRTKAGLVADLSSEGVEVHRQHHLIQGKRRAPWSLR